MWQSHVEIEDYSVVYFDRIAMFKAPYRWSSVKGGAHTRFVDSLDIHASTKHIWAPPLTEVSDTVLWTQRCDRNTRQNNLRFLHGTATYAAVKEIVRPWVGYPSCRHTTVASELPQESSHTVPHSLFMQISTLPSFALLPPASRSWPVVQETVW